MTLGSTKPQLARRWRRDSQIHRARTSRATYGLRLPRLMYLLRLSDDGLMAELKVRRAEARRELGRRFLATEVPFRDQISAPRLELRVFP